MTDLHQADEINIGWEVHALSESISELTRYANSHRELMRRDLHDLKVHYNRLALIISALEAQSFLEAAE